MEQSTPHTVNKSIALLIDADNVSHAAIAGIIAELSKYGTANIRRAYGDWTSSNLKGWRDKLHEFAIRPIQQFSYTSGKNATDIALVIDAMELLYTQKLSAFCIASSDGDFTPLVMQLRANGHDVYGFGQRKTPEPFVNACNSFLFLESLAGPNGDDEFIIESERVVSGSTDSEIKAVSKVLPLATPKSKPISQDTKLVTLLRSAVEALTRDDGWAPMSTVGSAVKRQSSIDPRNYGVKSFSALIEATSLFEIFKADGGRQFIADRRNRERSKIPTI